MFLKFLDYIKKNLFFIILIVSFFNLCCFFLSVEIILIVLIISLFVGFLQNLLMFLHNYYKQELIIIYLKIKYLIWFAFYSYVSYFKLLLGKRKTLLIFFYDEFLRYSVWRIVKLTNVFYNNFFIFYFDVLHIVFLDLLKLGAKIAMYVWNNHCIDLILNLFSLYYQKY